MSINLKAPELRELKPRIMVCGIGGAGGNAVNNMITSGLCGVDFIVANTDAQALTASRAERIIQMGLQVTEGLGAGSHPEVGRAAAEEAIDEIRDHLAGAHMVFVTGGMGGGTGTGAAPVIARCAREMGILTVGVVTKPFQFEGQRRMRTADGGITELQKSVDTLIVIPNQNLFRVANERTTFADAFAMADQVLYSGVACITDLMVKEGLINLDFADVRAVMRDMGKAMMGTGESSGEKRAIQAAEAAISNPLLDETSMRGARGLLISITGGNDLTLYEVDEAASRIRQEVDEDANIILGATFDESLDGIVRVSVVATGIDQPIGARDVNPGEQRVQEVAQKLRQQAAARQDSGTMQQAPIEIVTSPVPQPVHVPAPAPVMQAAPVQTMPQEVALEALRLRAAAVLAERDALVAAVQPVAQPVAHQAPQAQYQPQAYAEPAEEAFMPPAAIRPARMPRVEELPQPVQDQIRAHREGQPNQYESRRRGLLERIAAFGLNRNEEPAAPQQLQAQPQARPAPVAPVAIAPAAQRQPSQVHAEYAKRPQAVARPPQAQLDLHGRVTPQARLNDDDQFEIPAFLRRQAN
ncbi:MULTISPECIES: cell division protein FtsZ [unclassified Beijerinckia]|uniref:cell division protein FtsZ n=1 Tax=unclassified Beijerinckia TaxID=2638183 RepID=UPI00089A6624|nr:MULTISPECIES: cell division protein FtsZ [unclassified Beijerinckia]MDH7799603.1 cell division protein FtsZ [Beijerinckia sp. GAS462]SEB47596.1 cell division protein FtsZ [Beijerinckia sp. 28-YEA-48]